MRLRLNGRQELLRKRVFALTGNSGVDFDTLLDMCWRAENNR